MQLANRRSFGSALKRLGQLCATASRQLQIASSDFIFRRGNCRAASPLACGAACS
jgi:hypothetical protein